MPTDQITVEDAAQLARERIEAIKQAVSSGIVTAMDEASEREELKEKAEELKDGSIGKRQRIMSTLAELAAADDWQPGEIDGGVEQAVKARNFKLPTTVATFVNEMKLAMHPSVRGDFGRISGSVNDAWSAEKAAKEANAEAAQPFRKAFARQYHMLVKVMREASDGRTYMSQSELRAFAEANDPSVNPETMFKRFDKVRAQLLEFVNNFDLADVVAAHDLVKELTLEDFESGRRRKLGLPEVASQPAAAPTPAPKASKASAKTTTVVVPPTSQPANTVTEIDFDALLDAPAPLELVEQAA